MTARPRRLLLGQLAASGDCLYATTVARQIKADDPSCHLTWAIGSMCRSVIDLNPHVDEVWEVPLRCRSEIGDAWRAFVGEARERKKRGDFDDVYLTQIHPDNYRFYDGTVRASIFRGYPRPITVPVTPVLRLREEETARVAAFAKVHDLRAGEPVVLFECAAFSGQTFLTLPWALDVARAITRRLPGVRVVMSSSARVEAADTDGAIIDGSTLSFRENAALTHYCSLVLGCSSGISWLCTSDAAKVLPTIQFLSASNGMYGAMVHDLEHWGLSSEHVIELSECTAEAAARCAVDVLAEGIAVARFRHYEPRPLNLESYYSFVINLVKQGEVATALSSMGHMVARYGARREVVTDLLATVANRARMKFGRNEARGTS